MSTIGRTCPPICPLPGPAGAERNPLLIVVSRMLPAKNRTPSDEGPAVGSQEPFVPAHGSPLAHHEDALISGASLR